MYRDILIALDHSPSDEMLLAHVGKLAAQFRSRLLLLHVADGWAARNYERLHLSESEEMVRDRRYLDETAVRLVTELGLEVRVKLALGNPPDEILKAAEAGPCDLIAMASHGHKLLGDLIHGSTIDQVRHNTEVPILVVRGVKK
jgi:nucleotide-binding universal stress UspA family protein